MVSDAIARTANAGEDTFNADLFQTLGDFLFFEGAYEKAYERYRRAFQEAVRER